MKELKYHIRHALGTLLHDEVTDRNQVLALQARWESLQDTEDRSQLAALYEEILRVEVDDQPHQPSDLEGIRQLRPAGPRSLGASLSDEELYDKILGGLLARASGCTLGKPVEGWTKAQIEEYLKAFGEDDVTDYIPYHEGPIEGVTRYVLPIHRAFCRNEINRLAREDDMDFTVLGLHILGAKGLDFTTQDVGAVWLERMPYRCTNTAERAAYANLVNGVAPPKTATHRNPYPEWIGAQIRADAFGYVAPGLPEYAAELAYRDARLSHLRNGIYGEMWVAAAIAAAFVTDDINEVIEIATSEIPQGSRYAAMVRSMLQWRKEYPDWKQCWQRIHDEYGHLYWVHTLNNAALTLLGLLYGDMDLGKTISIAVQGGWDTDCTAATAGSILGIMLGAKALPERWVGPLQNTVETAVFGYNPTTFTALAEKGTAIAKQVLARSSVRSA